MAHIKILIDCMCNINLHRQHTIITFLNYLITILFFIFHLIHKNNCVISSKNFKRLTFLHYKFMSLYFLNYIFFDFHQSTISHNKFKNIRVI